MYQTVIRDPGGDGLIRIQPDVCGTHNAIVDGSILIVPPGTTAFININGLLSEPYGPGRYEIFTGVDPFFVRLRNILTRGDSATSVSVFFISTEKTRFMKIGTGEIPFREKRFQLTMKAFSLCSFSISISDPHKVLRHLIGSYTAAFTEEDLDPFIEQVILSASREAISKELCKLEITEFNSRLSYIKAQIENVISLYLARFGIRLDSFEILAINVPDNEISRLYEKEQELASGKIRTDIEFDNLKRIWDGDVRNRTFAEMMTGIPSRGQDPSGHPSAPPGGAGGFAPMMIQMLMMSQMLPSMREPIEEMTRHTNMFRNESSGSHESTSTADSPPPIPDRLIRCPSCNGRISRNTDSCPICGHTLNERR